MDRASCVWSGWLLLLRERGYGLIDAVGGSASSRVGWVEGGREGAEVIVVFEVEGY